jgi:glycerophosphoryl diester phosphodiesterase
MGLMKRRIYISGHRGTRVHEIENTKAAFDYCLNNKIDYIEFDVKKTKDNEVIVYHDGKINKLLNGQGSVEGFTLDQLRKFQYEDGQSIQTLAEFFEQVKKEIRPMLEIKSRNIGQKVMELVHQYGYQNDEILIQSFMARDLVECFDIDPQYDYGLCMGPLGKYLIFRKKMAKVFYNKFIKPYPFIKWLNLDGPFMYDEFLDLVHENGLHIILGANNTAKYLAKLDRWNVEIVNCDDATAIRKLVIDLGYSVS